MCNMSNEINLTEIEKLQVENILLKMEVASRKIDDQQRIINDWNEKLSETIATLRSKYELTPTWKLDTQNFKLVNTAPQQEQLVKLDQEETEPGE